MKAKLKVGGIIFGGLSLLGLVYPVMMWFEYDINVFHPRMSEYLKNRFK
jgi:hypothetical protein